MHDEVPVEIKPVDVYLSSLPAIHMLNFLLGETPSSNSRNIFIYLFCNSSKPVEVVSTLISSELESTTSLLAF